MTGDDPKIVELPRDSVPGSERKKSARKQAKRAPTTPGNQVRPRTAEEITNAQTIEQLATTQVVERVGHDATVTIDAMLEHII
jgi:hypothetical protein